jgi:hypothetical protein
VHSRGRGELEHPNDLSLDFLVEARDARLCPPERRSQIAAEVQSEADRMVGGHEHDWRACRRRHRVDRVRRRKRQIHFAAQEVICPQTPGRAEHARWIVELDREFMGA